ncbi:FAD-binding protein [Haloferax sp. MBLA0076]|uniref:FAD-binding protein n=1 Tax=Haloferax litoreum TaxID=2666140 RepID=A0A6A8GCA4_9EURY|nr:MULTISPECIES: FAD-binding oxidoreductase [Haloferax]KAB1192290.1 FAD-binding oxidoreductase [Haloferax sp. CBA1148]MRX20748.1 FAD-binding protein [Haloferax litoreum]
MALTADRPLANDEIDALRDRLRGDVLLQTDEEYDERRSIWNAAIDRRPAVVVRPLGAADVMAAVRFAREQSLEISIRGGGHHVAGHAVTDGGLMIDCSAMKSVRVNPDGKRAWVEPGALLHDVDVETQAHGLVLPGGFISLVGIGGLTLGGGFGYLSRSLGLTVDNLRSVELVTADGEFVTASESENSDLFWALRGGGGNFGVVTAFEFGLHELEPTVLAGPIVYDFADAPEVMAAVTGAIREGPDEIGCVMTLRKAPPAPFLPEEVHGQSVLIVTVMYGGDVSAGEEALAPIRAIGSPIADAVGPKPYAVFQTMFDAAAGLGARNYWKTHYLAEMSPEAIRAICDRATDIASPETAIGMMALGREIARRPADSTPYQHRDAEWFVVIQARWREADEDGTHTGWARGLFEDLAPHATGGVYLNATSLDEDETGVRDAFGADTYERLVTVKTEWDPENVFHLNPNVRPEA